MLPTLTCNILSYKRPWYTVLNIMALVHQARYDGPKRYQIVDGGSPEWQYQMYRETLKGHDFEILVEPGGGVCEMMNLAAARSGEVFLLVLDDFILDRGHNFTPDVRFLLERADVGHIRYGNMIGWDANDEVYARLGAVDKVHYWVLDKSRCRMSYMWTMGFSLLHRRMWDAYGPLASVGPHKPGEAELQMNRQFRERPGPTVAVPMRIGQQSDSYIPLRDAVYHIGYVRTDEYTALPGVSRWGAV